MMFYKPEILSMRKKGRFACIWLAATLNERLFRLAINNKALLSIRIDAIGDEVIRVVCTSDFQRRGRFSLYLSSQLMYGLVKVLSYQTKKFQDDLLTIHELLKPIDFQRKKRKRTNSGRNDDEVAIDLPEVPALEQVFKNLHLRADLHLMPEVDLEEMKVAKTRVYVESPTFGELTDKQMDYFLREDDWLLQEEPGLNELREPIRYGGEANNRATLTHPPSELQAFAMTDDFETVQQSAATNELVETIKTPKKRESRMTDVDTPTKRLRRNLGAQFNVAGEKEIEDEQPPMDVSHHEEFDQPLDVQTDLTDFQPVELPIDGETNVPALSAITSSIQPENATVPEDNEIHLDTLELEADTRPRRNYRIRKLIIDEHKTLHQPELAKFIGNTLAHTVPKEKNLIVPPRRQTQPAKFLLNVPSTYNRTTPEDSLEYGFIYRRWAVDLERLFQDHTIGPFIAEDDNTMNVEAVRLADSRARQKPEEISSGLERAMGLESLSRNKTTDEPSAKTIQQPSISETNEDHYQPEEPANPVVLDEISHEPIMENPEYPDTVSIANDLISNIVEPVAPVTTAAETPDPESGDLDAFLPPKLRTRSSVKKTSHEKRSSPEAIIDVADSPASLRSGGSMQSEWNKPELLAELAGCWARCPETAMVKFTDLAPPEHTTKLNAAACFTLLLELQKDRVITMLQDKPYETIFIKKAACHSRTNVPRANETRDT